MIRRPQRSDSLLGGGSSQLLAGLPDELHDMRRVQAYGQEEDLKEALGKMIKRVEELSAMLNHTQKTQTELETTLKLARSNLQLALANNEMLEDALRRESATSSKDVGWRRRSDRPESRQGHHPKEPSDGNSRPSSRRGSVSVQSTPTSEAMSPSMTTPESPIVKPATSPVPSHPVQGDSRFFRFRFGSSSAATSPNLSAAGPSRPRTPPVSSGSISGARRPLDAVRERDAAHLTSASLPSLVASTTKHEEELVVELADVRTKLEKVSLEKLTLEQEVEGLSQALFEEANKMVAQERIKCAEIEEELRQVRKEKEALKSAMCVIEQENEKLKTPALAFASGSQNSSIASSSVVSEDSSTPHGSRPISHVHRRSHSGGPIPSRTDSIDVDHNARPSSTTSSTRGFRERSSSSERGWPSSSSPSHASVVPLPDSESESIPSSKIEKENTNDEERHATDTKEDTEESAKIENADTDNVERHGTDAEEDKQEAKDGPTVLLTSPTLPNMPFEESPWARI